MIHEIHTSHVDSGLNWRVCITKPRDEYRRDNLNRVQETATISFSHDIPPNNSLARASPHQIQSNSEASPCRLLGRYFFLPELFAQVAVGDAFR